VSAQPGESQVHALEARVLEAITSGVITLEPSGTIMTFNRAAEATFGVRAGDWLGQPADDIRALIADFPDLLETFYSSGATHLRAEVEGEPMSGGSITLEIRMAPLELDGGTGVAIVIVDRGAQRALEEAHAAQVEHGRLIEASFARYLAPHVVRELMRDPGAVRLGGERQRATMLFADIRGFTDLATRLPADGVVSLLNRYFERAVRVIFAHEGLLDKFYGDGMMAVFGPPRVRQDDARRALQAALDLHEAVARLSPRLPYPLEISVGLASGDVVAGHIGSNQRMDYTVIGDAVNLASGLEAAAPPNVIYCDEATYEQAGLALHAERVEVEVKGRSARVPAYAIVSRGEGGLRENFA
jgi:adenylate cyclase